MDCFVGIDLGSTTTKAVIVDADGRIVGRGITNSRSNYDIAARVARFEAFTNARFDMLGQALRAEPGLGQSSAAFLGALTSGYRHECFLGQLQRLEDHCRRDVDSARYQDDRRAVGHALEVILQSVRQEAARIYSGGAAARSDFFRDMAGASYTEHAAQVARAGGPAFDRLIGLFDRNIIPVENEQETRTFSQLLMAALDRVVQSSALQRDAVAGVLLRVAEAEMREVSAVGTGYGRVRLPFPKENIRSEILCHGLGAHLLFPGTRTVLDIGGQDTKAIQIDQAGVVTSFQMNDRCAAGCGRYLGYIADEMNIGLHELGPLALGARRRIKINSTCTVFAGAEFRDRLAAGQAREDIVAGLHRAIILRAMSLLARSGGIRNEFTFTGGVGRNMAAVKALGEVAQENYGQLQMNIAPDSIYTGAIGAATFALRGATNSVASN